jgi:hypothetical protein
MATINFILTSLAVLTSLACTILLLRAYAATGHRLLLWSGWCFVFLTLNNALLFADVVLFPDLDLRIYRLLFALAGIVLLLYSFIWEAE